MGIGIIIGGIILILSIILTIYDRYIWRGIWGAFLGICALGIVSMISAAIYGGVVGVETVEVESTPIYSIGLRDRTEGSFMLGCGSVDTRTVYSYYVKDEDDFFILKRTYCSDTKLKETNEIQPCIKAYGKRFKDGKTSWMWAWGNYIFSPRISSYVIYIPEGSIIQTYNITP